MRTLQERMRSIEVTRYKTRDGNETIFIPLPPELWIATPLGCSCDTCKSDGTTAGYMDTMVVSAKGPTTTERKKMAFGSEWTGMCHYPELHPKRIRLAKQAEDAASDFAKEIA